MIRPEYGRLDLDAFLERSGVVGHAVEDLARAWPFTPDRLVLAFGAAGVELSEYQGTVAWVAIDQDVADHRRSQALHDTLIVALCETHIDHAELGPGLHVPDEELRRRLPLLELAEDLARRDGRLIVETVPPGGLWGCISATRTRGTVIRVDATLADGDLEETFAHELAHGLDPDVVGWRGSEAFADTLGPMLLEAEPASVKAAAFLVLRALDATASVRAPRPDGSISALLEQVLTEVGVTAWAGPQLLAARRGGSGRQPGTDGARSTSALPQGQRSLLGAAPLLRRDAALRPEPPGGPKVAVDELEAPTVRRPTAPGRSPAPRSRREPSPPINVRDYGARGDQESDDTDAVQAAMDAARLGSAEPGHDGKEAGPGRGHLDRLSVMRRQGSSSRGESGPDGPARGDLPLS